MMMMAMTFDLQVNFQVRILEHPKIRSITPCIENVFNEYFIHKNWAAAVQLLHSISCADGSTKYKQQHSNENETSVAEATVV